MSMFSRTPKPGHRWSVLIAGPLVVLSACSTSNGQYPGDPITTESATATQTIPFDAVADVSDAGNLVALSTHIFTGRVDGVAGTQSLGATPETQYDVTTAVAIKGSVGRLVVVNQQSGTRDGVYLSVGVDEPFISGNWYLFATRVLETKNWFTVIPGAGTVTISADDARNTSSAPLARLITALRNNPHSSITQTPLPSTPTMTFPLPTPGEQHLPPSSPAQTTPR